MPQLGVEGSRGAVGSLAIPIVLGPLVGLMVASLSTCASCHEVGCGSEVTFHLTSELEDGQPYLVEACVGDVCPFRDPRSPRRPRARRLARDRSRRTGSRHRYRRHLLSLRTAIGGAPTRQHSPCGRAMAAPSSVKTAAAR